MTTTPHPTITAFIAWTDLCVLVSGNHIEPVAARLAFNGARARLRRYTEEFSVEHITGVVETANRVATTKDSAVKCDGNEFAFTVGTVAAVLVMDGEKSRAYISAPKALADLLTFSD
jgi:hypothetical protein